MFPCAAGPASGKMRLNALALWRGKLSIGGQQQFLIGKMSFLRPHNSPLGRTGNVRQRSFQANRYRAERHIQNLGYFPIAQAFRPQIQTPAILLR